MGIMVYSLIWVMQDFINNRSTLKPGSSSNRGHGFGAEDAPDAKSPELHKS